MLSRRAIAAYCVACFLATLILLNGWLTTQVAWIENEHGDGIGLWKVISGDGEEFPGRRVCSRHEAFCALWRTATFLLTLSLVPQSLALLVLIFSWAFHHRKKTVLVVRYLLMSTIMIQFGGLVLWLLAYSDINRVLGHPKWKLGEGWGYVASSILLEFTLLLFMIPFRVVVRNYIELEESGTQVSDDEDDAGTIDPTDDDISIPEDVSPEQIDFYIFNKKARRQELARFSGRLS